MNTFTFASHDSLSDASNSVCRDCGWYGDRSELEGKDSVRCPDCGEITWENDNVLAFDEENIEQLVAEITETAIRFNRKHGYNAYAADVRTHNMTVEIDLHGFLQVRIIDWSQFYQDNSKMADYYVVKHEDINVNLPEHFDISVARKLLVDLEAKMREVAPFVVTQAYMSWCSEAGVDADDPDSHELYLESKGD